MENNNRTPRLFELDALRGLAALAVVLFHFTFGIDNATKIFSDDKFYFSYGYLGVHLFFLISGFVIFMTLDKTKKPFDFIVSRFSRLYPAYWAAIFTTIIFTIFLRSTDYTIKQVLINLTMLQHWFKIKDIDGAYWTLAVELTFYAIMWLIFVSKKLNYIFFISMIWLLIVAILSFFDIPFENLLNVFFIPHHAPLFIGGIAFFKIKTDHSKTEYHILVVCSYFCTCIVNYTIHADIVVYTVITLFYITFYLFVYDKLSFLNNRILQFLGTISYSVYLIHENVGISIILILSRIIDNQLFYLPITVLIIIVLATIINRFVEKPAMIWIRNKYRNHE